MKIKVEIVEAFVVRHETGPLVVRDILTGHEEVKAPPVVVIQEFSQGEELTFRSKKDAQAFIKAHGGKVRMAV